MPLLWVCHNFRAFVYARFCKVYKIYLRDDQGSDMGTRESWPSKLQGLDAPTRHLAEELVIVLDIQFTFKGVALQRLLSMSCEGCAFPMARKLLIRLHLHDGLEECYNISKADPVPLPDNSDDHSSDADDYSSSDSADSYWPESDDYLPSDSDQVTSSSAKDNTPPTNQQVYLPEISVNIAAFVQRVKQMVPMVRKVSVEDCISDKLFKRRNVYTMDLAQQLSDIVEKKTEITRGSDLLVKYLDIPPTRDLVHIDSVMDRKNDRVIPLIRHSVQTLKSLSIIVGFRADLVGIIKDPRSSKFLEYPSLHSLKISQFNSSYASQRSVFGGAVPFPRLCHLDIFYRYPFADDVLFRDNGATLEYFRMAPHPKTVSIIQKYNVFTPTSHPRLDCVIIRSLSRTSITERQHSLSYIAFFLGIGPNASVRVIPDLPRLGRVILPLRSLIISHTNIQVLALPYLRLALVEAMLLVSQLPLLSDLETDAPTPGGLDEGTTMADVTDDPRAICASRGRRFRCWHIYCRDFRSVDFTEVATCMLLMALEFPNFDYATMHRERSEPFMNVMKEKIDEPRFSKDAPRLKRLLFNGWNDKGPSPRRW
ncbi:hypothetical protein FBU31_001211 [Coemansia sp. 'formosensis']|nr:hypothetical protein FBU31_001211 [Coemansia sp. 'formosensis']